MSETVKVGLSMAHPLAKARLHHRVCASFFKLGRASTTPRIAIDWLPTCDRRYGPRRDIDTETRTGLLAGTASSRSALTPTLCTNFQSGAPEAASCHLHTQAEGAGLPLPVLTGSASASAKRSSSHVAAIA
jgi:hypothetical protein